MKAKAIILLLGCYSITALAIPVKSVDHALLMVQASVRKHNLTSLSDNCLLFDYREDKQNYVIDVREKHDKYCGSDPNVSPRLFTYIVDKQTGKMKTDDPVWTGEFREID